MYVYLQTESPNQRIEYFFDGMFWITYAGDGGCIYQWVEIKDGTDTSLRGVKYENYTGFLGNSNNT